MFELVLNHLEGDVAEADYLRLLGFPPGHKLADRARELADEARAWFRDHGRPWIFARETGPLEINADGLRIAGTTFTAKLLRQQFAAAGTDRAVVVAVSAGPECEEHARELWQAGRPDEYFFLEMFGSAVVEHLVAVANGHICRWADAQQRTALPHNSPGYSGWPITEQLTLWQLLPAPSVSSLPGRLTVLDSGMLAPKKSLLGLVGIAPPGPVAEHRARLIPCENCTLAHCQFRRAPHRFFRRPALT